jgi:hypothetical protein
MRLLNSSQRTLVQEVLLEVPPERPSKPIVLSVRAYTTGHNDPFLILAIKNQKASVSMFCLCGFADFRHPWDASLLHVIRQYSTYIRDRTCRDTYPTY